MKTVDDDGCCYIDRRRSGRAAGRGNCRSASLSAGTPQLNRLLYDDSLHTFHLTLLSFISSCSTAAGAITLINVCKGDILSSPTLTTSFIYGQSSSRPRNAQFPPCSPPDCGERAHPQTASRTMPLHNCRTAKSDTLQKTCVE